MRFALFLFLAFAVVGILLATRPENLQNDVDLALPFTQAIWTGPVLWMLAGWFGAGLIGGYLIALPGRVGAARRARRIEKELGQTQIQKDRAVTHLNEPAPPSTRRPGAPAEADEMQRLADEVARRTETVKRDPPRA